MQQSRKSVKFAVFLNTVHDRSFPVSFVYLVGDFTTSSAGTTPRGFICNSTKLNKQSGPYAFVIPHIFLLVTNSRQKLFDRRGELFVPNIHFFRQIVISLVGLTQTHYLIVMKLVMLVDLKWLLSYFKFYLKFLSRG